MSRRSRAYPGEKFRQAEGLEDVVVRARIEADDNIDFVASSREDEYLHRGISPTELAAHVDAIDVRKTEIENDDRDLVVKPFESVRSRYEPS